MEATITIANVETKSGTSQAGRAWTMYKIKDTAGTRYSTFDHQLGRMAQENTGKTARVVFETTDKGNDLSGIIITNDAPAPPAAQPQGNNGSAPDWDRIAVQKTRCALWVALYNGGMHDPTRAATLVYEAEKDIFGRTSAAPGTGGGLDSDIPFAPTV